MGPNTVVLWDPGPDRSQRGRGPYRGAVSQLRAGTQSLSQSEGEGTLPAYPLLMEWAGAGSQFSLRPAPLAPGGRRRRAANQITVFQRGPLTKPT